MELDGAPPCTILCALKMQATTEQVISNVSDTPLENSLLPFSAPYFFPSPHKK